MMTGLPEGELTLAQCVVYLAVAPKSNAVYGIQGRQSLGKQDVTPRAYALRNAPASS